MSEGRTGGWERFNDGAAAGTETVAVESSGGTADCDKWALHVKGGGYTSFAGFGVSLVGPPNAPQTYSATTHQFTGIKFRAKLGTGHDPKSPVRFNLSTPWTELGGATGNPGGACTPTTATTEKAALACFQHAGKFLSVTPADNELTTGWKTFTYCFDRDLYPLSLPSNLTNDQRNTIATNLLKVQFQFNQGKDYSLANYPAMGIYPVFAKTLPFDFWVDDLSFFTGACPTTANFQSTAGTTAAFGRNASVGTCAPAASAANFNTALTQAYARWTKNFVRTNSIVAPEQNGVITSEAMGYGMLITAAMGDKAAFDRFWGYVQGQLSGGLMTWVNGGSGSATDGDGDIAYALLMANAQWPTGGYRAGADAMIGAILANDVDANTVIKGGSQWRGPFNASYFSPAAYRKFTGFGGVVSKGYSLVNTNIGAATPGLPTDWGDPTVGTPSDHGDAQVTSLLPGIVYGYDAARVPWRIGLDVCTGGTEGRTSLASMVSFFAAKYGNGASIDLLKAGWTKATGAVAPNAKDLQGSFIGPMGVAGMAVGGANGTVMRDRAFRTILDILENGDFNHTYFPSTVGLLTALVMSGNFPMP